MKTFYPHIGQYLRAFFFFWVLCVVAQEVSGQQPPKFADIYDPAETTILYMFDNSWNEDDISPQRFSAFAAAPSSLSLGPADFLGTITPKKIACFAIKTKDPNAISAVEQKLKAQYPSANFRKTLVTELDSFIELVGPGGFKYNN